MQWLPLSYHVVDRFSSFTPAGSMGLIVSCVCILRRYSFTGCKRSVCDICNIAMAKAPPLSDFTNAAPNKSQPLHKYHVEGGQLCKLAYSVRSIQISSPSLSSRLSCSNDAVRALTTLVKEATGQRSSGFFA